MTYFVFLGNKNLALDHQSAQHPHMPRTVRGVENWRDDNQNSACAVALVSPGAVPRT